INSTLNLVKPNTTQYYILTDEDNFTCSGDHVSPDSGVRTTRIDSQCSGVLADVGSLMSSSLFLAGISVRIAESRFLELFLMVFRGSPSERDVVVCLRRSSARSIIE
ncbi:hypothetical protein L9F63_011448, partial [Diploptera punctata]